MQDCHCVELLYASAKGRIALLAVSGLLALNSIFYLDNCLHISESAILACLCHWCIANSDNLFVPRESRLF